MITHETRAEANDKVPPNKDLVKAIENILELKAFSLSVDKESVKSKNVRCNDAQMV